MTKLKSSGEIFEKISISQNSILEATRRWKASTGELEKGFLSQTPESHTKRDRRFRELQDRYLSISRYCSDAERLISFHSELSFDGQVEIFGIDPHILRAYSEPWDNGSHTGFRFFRGEGNEWSPDALRFPVFTYAGLFRKQPAIVLEAGRAELAELISYFLRLTETPAQKRENEVSFDNSKFLAGLKHAFGEDAKDAANESSAFDRLMLAGGEPQLKQILPLARLIGVMKSSRLQTPELAVRTSSLEGVSEESLDDFTVYLRFIRNNPAILNSLRANLDNAYRCFRALSQPSFDQSRLEAETTTELRGGELHDLNAIIETHVLNSCLQLADVPVNLNYVTLSLRMFNFVRQFDRSVLRASLLHPRSAIMLHDSELFKAHKNEMKHVVAGAIAFGLSIPKDGKITEAEIARFEDKFGETLESTKKTFIHALADSSGERNRMIESIDRVLARASDADQDEWRNIKRGIDSKLKEQVLQAGRLFSRQSPKLADEAWRAYEKFALNEDSTAKAYVLARRFVDKSKGLDRLVILPVGGSYRYLFSVYNEAAVSLFTDVPTDGFRAIPLRTLLETVDTKMTTGDVSTIMGRNNSALKYFVRSIFAASHGQWALAESLATQAHDCFVPEEFAAEPDGMAAGPFARARQCDQEILFLRHMCRRSLAYSSGPGRGRTNWLKRSAIDLQDSAIHTLAINRVFVGNKTRTDPTSVRQALSAFALQLEWLTRGETAAESYFLDCLPRTELPYIAWSGTSFNGEAIPEPGADLRQFGIRIKRRIEEDYAAVKAGIAVGHSEGNWRYFLMRCYMISLALETCIDTGLLAGRVERGDEVRLETDLDVASELFLDHESWEEGLLHAVVGKTASPGLARMEGEVRLLERRLELRPSRNPFGSAVLSATRVRLNVSRHQSGDGRFLADTAGLLSSFANMDINCHELNPFGFSRRLIRIAKKKYAPALISQLEREYRDVNADRVAFFGDVNID